MVNKKAIFFDLDGTLLPVDLDRMFGAYFELLKKSEVLRLLDEDTEKALAIFNEAARAMMANGGEELNADVFFDRIKKVCGCERKDISPLFDAFYTNAFAMLSDMVEKTNVQRKILDAVREKGYKTVLATMPVFPLSAAVARLAWVGLCEEDFLYITHYLNSSYMKPHMGYYTEILQNTGFLGEECFMVGNNVAEDMCAKKLGFDVFLVTGYEIGQYKKDDFRNGDLKELLKWAQALPYVEETE